MIIVIIILGLPWFFLVNKLYSILSLTGILRTEACFILTESEGKGKVVVIAQYFHFTLFV